MNELKSYLKIWCVIVCLKTVKFQETTTDNITAVINEIFQINNTQTRRQSVSDNETCFCVQYYLCQNNTLIKDGYDIIDIRLEGPCRNYLEVCCGGNDIVVEPITHKPDITEIDTNEQCGIRNKNGVAGLKITGDVDNETQFGEFPWMVAILKVETYNEQAADNLFIYTCGGSMISVKVVLTAAHCVTDKNQYQINPNKVIVRAGEWDTNTVNEVLPHQNMRIEKIVRHRSFNPRNLFNDIALLELRNNFQLNKHIRPICLPQTKVFDLNDYEDCYATGWGKDKFESDGEYQVIMKKINLPLIERRQCQQLFRSTRLGPYFELHESFICAGGESKRDTCKGDGGGPLVCRKKTTNYYEQIGITAWGIGCGEEGIPGAYVNVALFRDWVQSSLQLI